MSVNDFKVDSTSPSISRSWACRSTASMLNLGGDAGMEKDIRAKEM